MILNTNANRLILAQFVWMVSMTLRLLFFHLAQLVHQRVIWNDIQCSVILEFNSMKFEIIQKFDCFIHH